MALIKGLKRICMSCGMRFYDMGKTPIICPSCDTQFTGDAKVKIKRSRVAVIEEDDPIEAAPEKEVEDDQEEGSEATVSLEELDEDSDDEDMDEDIALDDDDIDIEEDDIDDLDDLEEDEEELVVEDEK